MTEILVMKANEKSVENLVFEIKEFDSNIFIKAKISPPNLGTSYGHRCTTSWEAPAGVELIGIERNSNSSEPRTLHTSFSIIETTEYDERVMDLNGKTLGFVENEITPSQIGPISKETNAWFFPADIELRYFHLLSHMLNGLPERRVYLSLIVQQIGGDYWIRDFFASNCDLLFPVSSG